MANSPSGESMLDRIIRVLSAFDADRPLLSVAAIANRANVPLPTCYRLVNQMVTADLLRKDSGGNISLGMRLWELASRSSPARDLRVAAMPFLDDVQSIFRQHTQLAVLDGDEVLVLERLSSRNSVVNQATIAGRMPTHQVSLGLSMLAFQPPAQIAAYVSRHPEVEKINYPGAAGLRSTLATIRQRGYAQLDGMLDHDTAGAAVPVFASVTGRDRTRVIASIGVVVPIDFEQRSAVVPVLLAASRGLTRALSVPEHEPASVTPDWHKTT